MLVTLGLGLRYVFVPTPWQSAYLALYCAFAGTFAESLFIDSDHWRHYFLLVGALWGLMMASRPYLPRHAGPAAQPGALARRGSPALSTARRSVAQPG